MTDEQSIPHFYRYVWGPRFCVPGLPVLDRKGQLCQVLVRGAMNSALVKFQDGERAVVSRNALRKLDAAYWWMEAETARNRKALRKRKVLKISAGGLS